MEGQDRGTGAGTVDNRQVVVGIDGSEHSRLALEWAVAKTPILGAVTPVLAYRVEPLGDGLGLPGFRNKLLRIMRTDAEAFMKEAIEGFPDVAERARIVVQAPGPALVAAADGADLLVVGNRGRGGLTETLFGSVGSYCVSHARVPIAVIIGGTVIRPTIDRVVVGVDGSANAARALAWAVRHTDTAGRVLAVGCWTDHVFSEPPTIDPRLEAATRTKVEETVASVRADLDDSERWPTVETHVERGDPRIVLRSVAATADLLVLGARGHRGVPHLLVGSTTTSLLHHPTVSTVVVPDSPQG